MSYLMAGKGWKALLSAEHRGIMEGHVSNRIGGKSGIRRLHRAALATTALTALLTAATASGPARATDAVWAGNGTASATLNLATVWAPAGGTPPDAMGTGFFGVTLTPNVFLNAPFSVGGFTFVPVGTFQPTPYTFFLNSGGTNNTLTFNNTGIVNNGTTVQTFNIGGGGLNSPATINFNTNGRIVNGTLVGSAGDSHIVYSLNAESASGNADQGVINFNGSGGAGGTGDAGSAAFTVHGATASGASGGIVNFNNSSTADNATIEAVGGSHGGFGGRVFFNGTSTAGNAVLRAGAGADSTSAGEVGALVFFGNSSAGNSGISLLGAQAAGAFGGAAGFYGSANAGSATIIVNGGHFVSGANGGRVQFNDGSTAGNANITLLGGTASGAGGGLAFFFGTATAGNSNITVSGGGAAGAGSGYAGFSNTSRAGTSTIGISGGMGAGVSGGVARFGLGSGDAASADHSTITVGAGSAGGGDGTLIIGDGHAGDGNTAGNATITDNGLAQVTSGGTLGAASVNNNKLLQFTGAGDGGSAVVANNVAGTVDISTGSSGVSLPLPSGFGTATNVVHLGSLAGGGTLKLGGNALVVGANNLSTGFSGIVTDTAATSFLVKTGTGTWTLNGVSGLMGTVAVINGGLAVGDGAHPGASLTAGAVDVGPSATLSGHGTIVAPVTNAGGTVLPGGSIGTLTVSSYNQSASGTLQIEVSPTANSELVVTPGGATLAGTLGFSFDPGTYSGPRLITFLHAAGGITNDFTTGTLTNAPPGGLVRAFKNGPQDYDAVIATGSALGGTGIPSISTALLSGSQDISGMVFRHLQDGRGGGAGVANAALQPQLAFATGGGEGDVAAMPGASSYPNRAWIRPFGTSGHIDNAGFSTGFEDQGGGVLAGIDHTFDGGFVLGGAAAYNHDGFSTNVTGTTGDVDSYRFYLYGSYEMGALSLDALGGYTYDSIDTARRFPGAGTASAKHNGNEGVIAFQASYRVQWGGASVIPWAGFSYFHLSEDGFVESGAPGFNLQVANHTTDSAQLNGGVRINGSLQSGDLVLIPELRAGVSQELAQTTRGVTAQFPGVPLAGSFVLTGAMPDRTAALLGIGLTAKTSEQLDLFIDADGRLSSNQQVGVISAGARVRF